MESPKGFGRKDKLDMVLRLVRNIYGLEQVPKTFLDKLCAILVERGFTTYNHDLCLFMRQYIICVIYADDIIIAGLDSNTINELIKDFGVSNQDYVNTFQLRDEGGVGYYLSIRID